VAKTKKTPTPKTADKPAPPKRARQTEIKGARPNADKAIDRAAEELDEHRCARLTAAKKEQEAEAKLIAIMQGKGLTTYLLADGDMVTIGPKNSKIGAKIVAPDEDDEIERRQTKLAVESIA
jgi:hypothetical protein